MMADQDEISDEFDEFNEISDWFWDIIRRAEHNEEKLREILMGLDRGEVTRFIDEYDSAAVELMEPPYTNYLDALSRNSEDEVDYLARWVVSQGKEYYTQVLEHPRKMPRSRNGRENPFSGVAVDVEYDKR